MNFVAAVEILHAVVYGQRSTTPCVPEYTNVAKCLQTKNNDACLVCILDVQAAIVQDNMTFPDLLASNYCGELHSCATEKCDTGCSSEWSALYTCAEDWADKHAEDAEICPGLEKAVSFSPDKEARNMDSILVQGFDLPFNYTNSESMASF